MRSKLRQASVSFWRVSPAPRVYVFVPYVRILSLWLIAADRWRCALVARQRSAEQRIAALVLLSRSRHQIAVFRCAAHLRSRHERAASRIHRLFSTRLIEIWRLRGWRALRVPWRSRS